MCKEKTIKKHDPLPTCPDERLYYIGTIGVAQVFVVVKMRGYADGKVNAPPHHIFWNAFNHPTLMYKLHFKNNVAHIDCGDIEIFIRVNKYDQHAIRKMCRDIFDIYSKDTDIAYLKIMHKTRQEAWRQLNS